jgi:hypothetical protein
MNHLFQTLVQVFAMSGLDKRQIQDVMPEATDEILNDADYDLGQKMGKLTSMAVAGGLRRHFDNLMAQGFTRAEAVQIVAGIAGNVGSK